MVERLLDHAGETSSQRPTLPGLANAALFPATFQNRLLGVLV